jgi:hypothetical protein
MTRTKKIFAGLLIVISALGFQGCMSVPYTGQYAWPDGEAKAQAFRAYRQFMDEAQDFIVTGTPEAQMVQEVGDRIIQAAKTWARANGDRSYLSTYKWEVTLIRSNERNAWCMAGGKIVIYTGILPITQNADGLAAVMGHEVAHALLGHTTRKKQAEEFAEIWANIGLGSKHSTELPYSRAMEVEADKVGLTLMVIAGYNGEEAAAVWRRWSALGGETAEFLSTHPSDSRRIRILQNELRASQRIAARVNNGQKAVQFVEKTLSVGGGTAGGILTAGNSGADNLSDALFQNIASGANFFIDASYFELKAEALFGGGTKLLYGGYVKWPFHLNDIFTWYPSYGIEMADNNGPFLCQNLSIGLDYTIKDRLFLRGVIGYRLSGAKNNNWEGISIIPVSISAGYALK